MGLRCWLAALALAAAVTAAAGAQSTPVSPNIVGGDKVVGRPYDWVASLRDRNGHYCGGVLVGDGSWVLTAAHCVSDKTLPTVIALGQYNPRDRPEPGSVWVAPKQVIIHEYFNPFMLFNDVAVIELHERVTSIAPAQLATSPTQDHDKQRATVVGWGAVKQNGKDSRTMLKTRIPIVSFSECTARRAYRRNEIDPTVNLCAGFQKGGKDACQGDSGGPLFTTDENGHDLIIGLVSWGEGCARKYKYGVYSRISSLSGWIHSVIGLTPLKEWEQDNNRCRSFTTAAACEGAEPACDWDDGAATCGSLLKRPTLAPTPTPTTAPTKSPSEPSDEDELDRRCASFGTKSKCKGDPTGLCRWRKPEQRCIPKPGRDEVR
mmetsp:Transcript_10999/g.35026  ORF Transcript_10999/g.35026 Transcript_10999/m.35026 type:complete len:376 (-) Transcript_10999:87-1214(-)